MREGGEKSNERNAAEQWSDQLIDLDQRDQKTRSDKNQCCAKRGGNTKTELQVVRFPEQTGHILDRVGLPTPDRYGFEGLGIAVVRSDGSVGFVFEDTGITCLVQSACRSVKGQSRQEVCQVHVRNFMSNDKNGFPCIYCSQNIGFIHALPVGKPCLASSQRSANSDAR